MEFSRDSGCFSSWMLEIKSLTVLVLVSLSKSTHCFSKARTSSNLAPVFDLAFADATIAATTFVDNECKTRSFLARWLTMTRETFVSRTI